MGHEPNNLHTIRNILLDPHIHRDTRYHDTLSFCSEMKKSLLKTIIVHDVPKSDDLKNINDTIELSKSLFMRKLKILEYHRYKVFQLNASLFIAEIALRATTKKSYLSE